MPRSSRGSSGPRASASSRPVAQAPARPQPQQQRPMSTTATQTQTRPPPPAQAGQSPGLFGQMASTAAGVAVGSSIGHAIGGWFGGGSSQAAPPLDQQAEYQQPVDSYAQPGQAMDSALYNSSNAAANEASGPCARDIKTFTDCMTQNKGDMNICSWYLEQLRACQQASKQY